MDTKNCLFFILKKISELKTTTLYVYYAESQEKKANEFVKHFGIIKKNVWLKQ
jgi:uncharacterized membrane protein